MVKPNILQIEKVEQVGLLEEGRTIKKFLEWSSNLERKLQSCKNGIEGMGPYWHREAKEAEEYLEKMIEVIGTLMGIDKKIIKEIVACRSLEEKKTEKVI